MKTFIQPIRKIAATLLMSSVISISSVTSVSAAPPAKAQAPASSAVLAQILQACWDIGGLLNNTIHSTVIVATKLLYTQSPDIMNTIAANASLARAITDVIQTSQTKTNDVLQNYLLPDGGNQPSAQQVNSTLPINASRVSNNMLTFSAQGLVSNDSLNATQQTKVLAFINHLLDRSNITGNLSPQQLTDALSQPTKRNYLLALSNYVASQSIAINNLYRMYAQRVVQPGLGTQAGLIQLTGKNAGQPIPNASQLQVERFLANKRVLNPQWYADMEKASPATLQREMLYVLAEMRNELFSKRMEMQALSLQVSALSLQFGQVFGKQTLIEKLNTIGS